MQKIVLALGHEKLEKYLKTSLSDYSFIGEITYREAIMKNCIELSPDILILRETLPGSTNILSLVYDIRTKCPTTRIIFLSKAREIGDEFLSELVSLGVYDIIANNPININEIIKLITKPNSYLDVSFYRPKVEIDENSNKTLFKIPTQITKKIYIEKEDSDYETKDKKKDTFDEECEKNDVPIGRNLIEDEKENTSDKDNEIQNENQVIEEEKEEIIEIDNYNKSISKGGAKLFSFVGSNGGIGCTQISFNLAVSLAKKNKVLYVDISNAPYTFANVFLINPTFSKSIYSDINELRNSILNKKVLKRNSSFKNDVSKNYKLLPDNLDMLFLPILNYKYEYANKDLLINLAINLNYDFIIFDFSNIDLKLVEIFLKNSNSINIIISQDFNYIAKANKIKKSLIDLGKSDINLIMNKYEEGLEITNKKIESFIDCKVVTAIPYAKEFNHFNYIAIPTIIKTKNSELIKSLNKLENFLINNKK